MPSNKRKCTRAMVKLSKGKAKRYGFGDEEDERFFLF
jgi:hypothetical protein